jgi:septation ring formation regulator EzrA
MIRKKELLKRIEKLEKQIAYNERFFDTFINNTDLQIEELKRKEQMQKSINMQVNSQIGSLLEKLEKLEQLVQPLIAEKVEKDLKDFDDALSKLFKDIEKEVKKSTKKTTNATTKKNLAVQNKNKKVEK